MRCAHVLLVGSILIFGCGDDDDTVADAPITTRDAAVRDAAVPDAPRIENVALGETRQLAGLTAPVDVVRDNRGVPHIFGASDADVVTVQAYLMARDRYPQMEFLRRLVLGRLGELIAFPDLVSSDTASRTLGYGRQGRAIYAGLAAGDPTKVAVDAFAAGVNLYIDEIKAAPDKNVYIPTGLGLIMNLIFNAGERFDHWTGADLFALARFQSANLAYDDNDLSYTQALLAGRAAFGENPVTNPRAGTFADVFSMVQGRTVYTRDGFPEATPKRKAARGARTPATATPSRALIEGARAKLAAMARARNYLGDEHRGSNNWLVSKTKTASGHNILSNDPHLQLTSPPVWWYVHLNTKRAGGDIDAIGVAFAGLPGVVLGHNADIAWGATTAGYDVTDIYEETLDGDGVVFNGATVPIQSYDEDFYSGATLVQLSVDHVPHHGVILSRDGDKALSIKYTGDEPSNELAYFIGLLTATNVAEARAAQENFEVGAQNFVVASRDDIMWSSRSRIPLRDPRALTLEISPKGIVTGTCPNFVLPGTGQFEWIGDLDPDLVPHDLNPARGFIATANQDTVGVTHDGNPCNDPHYIGGSGFANGYRQGRIVERLTALTGAGGVTVENMIALQAETQSSLGDTTRDPIVAALDRAQNLSLFTTEEKAVLAAIRTRLAAWSLKTPHGVDATDPAVIADSVATTLFTVGVTRIIPLAFADEITALTVGPGTGKLAVLFDRAVARPAELATYDGTDTVLWDNMGTAEVESRDVIIARGFLNANSYLVGRLGADVDSWRWGRLHTVIFESIFAPFGVTDISVPATGAGFPRHGDYNAVDVGDFGLQNTTDFRHRSGASFRSVVEIFPEGPRAFIALPGGQSIETKNPHHADEAELWIRNQQTRLAFTEAEIVANAETRLRFTP